jgi:hypothetical protein
MDTLKVKLVSLIHVLEIKTFQKSKLIQKLVHKI